MGSVSTDMYFPALPRTAHDLGVGTSAIQLTVTAFLIGLAFGQIVGPISDVRGRRVPLLVGVVVYIVASLGCALAPSLSVLVLARLLQGFSAAAGVVITRAIIRDLVAGPDVARYYSRLFFMIAMVAIASPVVGTQVLSFTTWRGIFFIQVGLGAAILIVTFFRLPETLAPAKRRAPSARLQGFTLLHLLRDRRFIVYALTMACGGSTLLVLVSAAPFLIPNEYKVPLHSFGFIFSAGAMAVMCSTLLNAKLLGRFSERRLIIYGFAGNVTCGVALITIGHVSVWMFAVCFVSLIGSWGFIAANVTALAVRDYQRRAGSAIAVFGLFQYGVGGLAAPAVAIAGQETVARVGLFVLILGLLGGAGAVLGVSRDRRRILAESAATG